MPNPRVFFLTEGGRGIGLGHLSRCGAIYQAFIEAGIKPVMLVKGDETVKDFLKDINYRLVNWHAQAQKALSMIKDSDICIIDSYLAKKDFYHALSQIVSVPVYIDDDNRIKYPPGIILNGNIYGDDLGYKKCHHLLGQKYLYLRKIFWKVKPVKIKSKASKIFITLGGHDMLNMTPEVLKVINQKFPDLKKMVVIGQGFSQKRSIKKIADENTTLIIGPSALGFQKAMREADIAVSAGGQTLAELARLGVATLGILAAENQRHNLNGWQKAKVIRFIGTFHDKKILFKNLVKGIKELQGVNKRKAMAKRGLKIADGNGPKRIVKELLRINSETCCCCNH